MNRCLHEWVLVGSFVNVCAATPRAAARCVRFGRCGAAVRSVPIPLLALQVSGKRKHIVFEWEQAESKFHSLDADGNGMLDFGELLSILFPTATPDEARPRHTPAAPIQVSAVPSHRLFPACRLVLTIGSGRMLGHAHTRLRACGGRAQVHHMLHIVGLVESHDEMNAKQQEIDAKEREAQVQSQSLARPSSRLRPHATLLSSRSMLYVLACATVVDANTSGVFVCA